MNGGAIFNNTLYSRNIGAIDASRSGYGGTAPAVILNGGTIKNNFANGTDVAVTIYDFNTGIVVSSKADLTGNIVQYDYEKPSISKDINEIPKN